MSPSTTQMRNLAERLVAREPQMRNLAKRLIAHETREHKSSGTKSPATFPVCEKLRPPLAALVGDTGFNALLSRSLVLASRESPWLRAVQVEAHGCLEGLAELEAQARPEEIAEGLVNVLAQMFELLRTFIGENLTLQLLRDVWPQLPLDDWYSGNEGGNENKKSRNPAQIA